MANEARLDSAIQVAFRGEDEEQKESEQFLYRAFLVALFVMAIILVTQSNSIYQDFLILSAVIFSTVGVFIGLLITHQPFGIVMNGIGVISLAGIVVNIDFVSRHFSQGAPSTPVVDAARHLGSLRPRLRHPVDPRPYSHPAPAGRPLLSQESCLCGAKQNRMTLLTLLLPN